MPASNAASASDIGLGMDTGSISLLTNAGASPDYASYWVGEWVQRSGWTHVENALKTAKAAGATPVVYWYYWGDQITPSCVENGCSDKDRAEWDAMTNTLAQKVRDIMQGAPTYIVLENEFNKGGITDAWYAPTFDTYLAAKATTLKAVPGVKIVLGYGSWGQDRWSAFPKAIAASDMIGFQMMRGSTRDSEASYRGAPDTIASVLKTINGISPGKKAFLYDVALSSYPDNTYRTIQAQTLQSIMDRRAEFATNGLVGLVYRESRDNPSMGTWNYFGVAEQYWGFRDTSGVDKPAMAVWVAAAKQSAPPAPAPTPAPALPTLPASFEGESMSASTGGRSNEGAASGGATWNLWTNGQLSQGVNASGGTYRATVVARGSLAAGVAPNMELRVDGTKVAGWSVASTTLTSYTADITLPAGTKALSVAFTNDAVVNGQDRNLFVDVLKVEAGSAPAPTNQPPIASFATSGSGLSWSFDASASSDPDGNSLTYAWKFGDGATGAGKTATHAYAAGTYTVTLTVSDGKATATKTATVTAVQPNRAPVAAAVATGSLDTYTFDASGSTDADGDTLAFAWVFPDGGTATGAKVTHTFAAAGAYTATVTVTDGKGGSSKASVSVAATKPAPFSAEFTPKAVGNEWWVQVSVSANRALSGVCASVDGGACQPLKLQSWGDWAASFQVAPGAKVTFTATSTDGATATSAPTTWGSAPAPATATFTPYDGNAWWVQTKVTASQGVKSVCASVNGGACQTLTLRSWGAWAAAISAPTGAKVVFTATLADGQSVKSTTYTWPVA